MHDVKPNSILLPSTEPAIVPTRCTEDAAVPRVCVSIKRGILTRSLFDFETARCGQRKPISQCHNSNCAGHKTAKVQMRAHVVRLAKHPALAPRPLDKTKVRLLINSSQASRWLSEQHHPVSPADARVHGLGKEITDTYAFVKDRYDAPRYPVVLAHGLLGFAELKLAGSFLPPIHYWYLSSTVSASI